MSIRTRKLIGAFALLALVTVWSLLAMALAQSVLTDINGCRDDLLRRRRPRLGAAGHAADPAGCAAGPRRDR